MVCIVLMAAVVCVLLGNIVGFLYNETKGKEFLILAQVLTFVAVIIDAIGEL